MTVKAPFVPEPSPPPSGIRRCPVRLHPNRAAATPPQSSIKAARIGSISPFLEMGPGGSKGSCGQIGHPDRVGMAFSETSVNENLFPTRPLARFYCILRSRKGFLIQPSRTRHHNTSFEKTRSTMLIGAIR